MSIFSMEILPIFFFFQLDSSEAIKRVLGGENPSETLARDRKKRYVSMIYSHMNMYLHVH